MKQKPAIWKRVRSWVQGRQEEPVSQADSRESLSTYQQTLLKEMRDLHRASEAHLQQLVSEVSGMDDEALHTGTRALQESHQQVRRSVERLRIAHADTQELLREWDEWQGMMVLPGYAATPQHEERREMVRSELVTRGVRIKSLTTHVEVREQEKESPILSMEEQFVLQEVVSHAPSFHGDSPDHLDEWEECFGDEVVITSVLYEDPDTDEEMREALERARQLKMHSAEQRISDRFKGLRRARLGSV